MNKYLGQSLSEYTLVGALVAVASLGGLYLLGASVSDNFNNLFANSSVNVAGPVSGSPSAPSAPVSSVA